MVDVSVIIPAWNAELTIGNAIVAALLQTNITVEVIIADDASTDSTGAVVQAFNDHRVRYLRLATNGGPAVARNAAIAVAEGAWIAVLDADDSITPDRLNKLVAAAVTSRLDIIADNMLIEDAAGKRRLFIPEVLNAELQRTSLAAYVTGNRLFGNAPSHGYLKPIFAADLLRRHELRYDTAMRVGEDFMLVAEALTLGARYGRIRSADYIYATRAGSISHRLTGAEANAMVDADKRYLHRHYGHLDHVERAAWKRHLASLEDGAGFVAMVDSLKAKNFGELARCMWRRPTAIRHFSMPIRARIERLLHQRPPSLAAKAV